MQWFLAQVLNADKLPKTSADSSALQEAFNTFYVILGALAVLLFVIAGLRYVTSQGDPAKVATAKMRLLHIAIGLIIVALATAIVNFVARSL